MGEEGRKIRGIDLQPGEEPGDGDCCRIAGRRIEKGQRVALLSEGCSDWVCSELGILYAGGVNVPLSIRLTARELVFRINHSGARFVFVSPFYLHILNSILGELESVEK